MQTSPNPRDFASNYSEFQYPWTCKFLRSAQGIAIPCSYIDHVATIDTEGWLQRSTAAPIKNIIDYYLHFSFSQRIGLAMEYLGVHPTIYSRLFDPFQNKYWDHHGHIGAHNAHVAAICKIFAKELWRLGIFTAEEVQQTECRGYLHDLTKLPELMIHQSRRARKFPQTYSTKNLNGILEIINHPNNNVPFEFHGMLHDAGVETDHSSIPLFIALDERGEVRVKEGMLMQKIVFLANCMALNTLPKKGENSVFYTLSPFERFLASSQAARYGFFSARYGYGVNLDDGSIIEVDSQNVVKNIRPIGSFMDLSAGLAKALCHELVLVLGIEGAGEVNPDQILKGFCNERIAEEFDPFFKIANS